MGNIWTKCRNTFVIIAALAPVLSAKSQVVLEDAKARVSLIDLGASEEFMLKGAEPTGSVYIYLEGGAENGQPKTLRSNETVSLQCAGNRACRVLEVENRKASQAVTALPYSLEGGQSLDDSSARNDTLLIAISKVRLQDGPEIIQLAPGGVSWIQPGVHHLKNLRSFTCRFVTVEWQTPAAALDPPSDAAASGRQQEPKRKGSIP